MTETHILLQGLMGIYQQEYWKVKLDRLLFPHIEFLYRWCRWLVLLKGSVRDLWVTSQWHHQGPAPPDLTVIFVFAVPAAQLEFVQILVIVVVMMVMVVVITCLLNHYRLSARSLLSRHAPTRRRHLPLASVSLYIQSVVIVFQDCLQEELMRSVETFVIKSSSSRTLLLNTVKQNRNEFEELQGDHMITCDH